LMSFDDFLKISPINIFNTNFLFHACGYILDFIWPLRRHVKNLTTVFDVFDMSSYGSLLCSRIPVLCLYFDPGSSYVDPRIIIFWPLDHHILTPWSSYFDPRSWYFDPPTITFWPPDHPILIPDHHILPPDHHILTPWSSFFDPWIIIFWLPDHHILTPRSLYYDSSIIIFWNLVCTNVH